MDVLFSLMGFFLLVGCVLVLLNLFFPMPSTVRWTLNIVIVVVALSWLIYAFAMTMSAPFF